MPLEIRQIAIQMHVAEDAGEADAGADAHGSALDLLDSQDEEDAHDRLIDQCVAAVLAELSRRAER